MKIICSLKDFKGNEGLKSFPEALIKALFL
jgi:hypothetical protein